MADTRSYTFERAEEFESLMVWLLGTGATVEANLTFGSSSSRSNVAFKVWWPDVGWQDVRVGDTVTHDESGAHLVARGSASVPGEAEAPGSAQEADGAS